MWKRLALLTAFHGVVFGQFRNLATNDDGSLLIFSSTLRLEGTDELTSDKLFSVDASGLQLYAERRNEGTQPGQAYTLSNYYQMEGAELSGDGSVRALISYRVCLAGGSSCFLNPPKVQSELTGLPGQGTVVLDGDIRLSPNGRYGFLFCNGSQASPDVLRDLYTGETQAIPFYQCVSARPIVSSTGMAVLPTHGYSLLLATLSGVREIATSAEALQAVIDDHAGSAVYEGQTPAGGKLLARVDLATLAEHTLIQAANLSLIGASSDGRVLAFLSTGKLTSAGNGGLPQLFTIQADGTGLRQVTQDLAGIGEATLAGNGTIAYAVTAAGRLIRIDLVTGVVTELIGRTLTLQVPDTGPNAVAGSAFCIGGTGFADAAKSTAPPLPGSFNGLQILLDGQPVPLQSVGPAKACLQIPWETSTGLHTLAAITDSDPRFQGGSPATLNMTSTTFAQFVRLGAEYPVSVSLQPYPVAAQQDFSDLVTRANPARPGEIIHFYMTGLGPVDQSVPTGSASPASPPAAATAPFACSFADFHAGNRRADVLFAGLAPGLAGYYQVSVRLPVDIPVSFGDALIGCSAGPSFAGEDAWIPIAQP
jgi:uncharacterized protein (TIGR03437 family)